MSTLFGYGQFYGVAQFGFRSAGLDIRASAATGCEEDVHLHTHQDAHFVLVLSGRYRSSARGAPELAGPPALVFNPPGTTHRDRFAGGVGTFVTVSVPAAHCRDIGMTGEIAADAAYLGVGEALSAAFRVAREVREARDPVVMEAAVWEMMALVAGAAAPQRHVPGWIPRAYEAIMDRSTEADLCVRDVAAAVGVHPVHLARAFRATWGCSPGELIRWRRLDRAAALLRSSLMPAAQIAAESGFVDQSHMTRAFRAAYRITPAAYRRTDVSPIQA